MRIKWESNAINTDTNAREVRYSVLTYRRRGSLTASAKAKETGGVKPVSGAERAAAAQPKAFGT